MNIYVMFASAVCSYLIPTAVIKKNVENLRYEYTCMEELSTRNSIHLCGKTYVEKTPHIIGFRFTPHLLHVCMTKSLQR